jgi:hypothetical protein
MARQTPTFVKSFPADTALASANRAVVASTANAGNVMLPAAAGAVGFIGVTQNPASDNGQSQYAVDLVIHGIAQIASDGSGTITAGKYVQIADTNGQIKQAADPAYAGASVVGIIGIALNSVAGTAGLLVDVLIQPHVWKP